MHPNMAASQKDNFEHTQKQGTGFEWNSAKWLTINPQIVAITAEIREYPYEIRNLSLTTWI